jgi:hypothetical protein
VDPASLILYIFFLFCSAYCASAETAFTAVSKVRLRTMADKGNKRAKKALWVCDRFDKTLTTILIGNNVFHAACASLSALLVMREFEQEFVVYGTLITTLIVYLFAEMIPKSLAKARAEEMTLLFSGSMVFFVKLAPSKTAHFAFHINKNARNPIYNTFEISLQFVYIVIISVLAHIIVNFTEAHPFESRFQIILSVYVSRNICAPFLYICVLAVAENLFRLCHKRARMYRI